MKSQDVRILEENNVFVVAVRRSEANGKDAPWSPLTWHRDREDAQHHASLLIAAGLRGIGKG
jgi:hypothetical protein